MSYVLLVFFLKYTKITWRNWDKHAILCLGILRVAAWLPTWDGGGLCCCYSEQLTLGRNPGWKCKDDCTGSKSCSEFTKWRIKLATVWCWKESSMEWLYLRERKLCLNSCQFFVWSFWIFCVTILNFLYDRFEFFVNDHSAFLVEHPLTRSDAEEFNNYLLSHLWRGRKESSHQCWKRAFGCTGSVVPDVI